MREFGTQGVPNPLASSFMKPQRELCAAILLLSNVWACGQSAKPPIDETGSTPASASAAAPASVSAPASAAASAPVSAAAALAASDDQCGGTAGPYEAQLRPLVKK